MDGTLLATWMDNKPVHFISTFLSKVSEVERVIKEGERYVGSQLIKIPTVAMIYNQCMGGTDQFDQMLSYYKTTVKTKKWQTRVFTHFLMCSVVNSSILYRLEQGTVRGQKGHDLLSFVDMLIDELVTPLSAQKEARSAEDAVDVRFVGVHSPALCLGVTVQVGKTLVRPNVRAPCKVCSKRTNQYCKTCKVALCFAGDCDDDDSCFEAWHSPATK